MFTAMVGVELTQEMVDINQRTDDLKAEVETRFTAGESFQDLEAMKVLLEAQTGVINQQTEVIQNLEWQVAELWVIALETREELVNLREPRGNTLGDPILVEEEEEEEEEEVVEEEGEIEEISRETFEAGPRVVTDLVLIEDD